MAAIPMPMTMREVTVQNWQDALHLDVLPEQLHYVAGYAPIAAIGLAKAYLRPGGLTWTPYVFFAGGDMIGFTMLAYDPASADNYWIFHFFIDHRYQGRGYGKQAMHVMLDFIHREHPRCQVLSLTVHPDNAVAQRLYTRLGFQPTGAMRWGEHVYQLQMVRQPGAE